jgi:hypothetical protein
MKKIKSITLILFSFIFLTHLALQAQCVLPFEAGNWKNIDANTNGITRLNVSVNCNDVVLCGVDGNGNVHCSEPGPPYTIQIWGKCSPSDCDWGTAPGNDYYASDGTHWKYFFYNQGFAKRYVYIKQSSLYPGKLFLWMYTDFTSPSRPDYIMRNWFYK